MLILQLTKYTNLSRPLLLIEGDQAPKYLRFIQNVGDMTMNVKNSVSLLTLTILIVNT